MNDEYENIIKIKLNNKITSTKSMFQNCNSIIYIDLTKIDASSITDMSQMFMGCNLLESINLSNINASEVISMKDIFSNCNSLLLLNLSNFKICLACLVGAIV